MKKKLFAIISILILMSHVVYAGTPIRIVKKYEVGNISNRDATENDISAELEERTLIVEFHNNFGPADISVETMSGNVAVTTVCLFTPDNAYVTVPDAGCYTITITTSEGVFVGYFTTN